uniref:Secreted protein n=1 Tax=Moschus moschiferus TaxID=68415 RepID=A0A8C6MM97_MOSMO
MKKWGLTAVLTWPFVLQFEVLVRKAASIDGLSPCAIVVGEPPSYCCVPEMTSSGERGDLTSPAEASTNANKVSPERIGSPGARSHHPMLPRACQLWSPCPCPAVVRGRPWSSSDICFGSSSVFRLRQSWGPLQLRATGCGQACPTATTPANRCIPHVQHVSRPSPNPCHSP